MLTRKFLSRIGPIVGCALLLGCSTPPKHPSTHAGAAAQPTFGTAEDAVVALMNAAAAGDVTAVHTLLGPEAAQLDAESPERTAGDLQRLAIDYVRGHELVQEQDGSVTLVLDGAERRWSFPVPLVSAESAWRFDTASGVQNVIDMRIARNETEAIRFMLALIDCQKQYFMLKLGPGGTAAYAPKFLSQPEQRDGLYWSDELGAPRSPLGPIADAIAVSDYRGDAEPGEAQPFLGYWYRILTFQGEYAPGGRQDYVDADGALTGSFAFLAWPEEYGRTGVKSFLVSSDGQVWEQDLGPDSAAAAHDLDGFDPGPGWERTEQY